MRMWAVNPKVLCQKHLLGEHVETHMFVGTIRKGISIQGYIDKGLVNPARIIERHDLLAKEMTRRGMNHKSPIPLIKLPPEKPIAVKHSLRELKRRCPDCQARILKGKF
jgi:hypothetical protein